ncbi:MAG: DUF3604 domain-containing protein [Kiritimatiellia bacterium]|nr:DUF3604 domain-containing protein [Lentisphaerota bacterium]
MIRAQCRQEEFRAGEPCCVEINLVVDRDLTAGDCVEFQFPNSWLLEKGPSHPRVLQSADPAGKHHVAVAAPETPASFDLTISKRNLFYPAGPARHGRLVTAKVHAGRIPAGSPILIRYANTCAPYVAETEALWLRVNGQAPEAAPRLITRAGEHVRWRVIVPSCCRPGESFEVLVVSLDRFDNASSSVFPDEKLVRSDGAPVADKLRLVGSLRVPASIQEPGVYRFRFGGAVSNAVMVDARARKVYWGDIHIHSKLSHDGQGAEPYGYAREISGLDFAGLADHFQALGPVGYRVLSESAEKANVPGVFVTIPGDERNPGELTGHHNVYFRDMPMLERNQAIQQPGAALPANSFTRLHELDPAEVMLVPHHTGISFYDLLKQGIGNAVDWDACDDRGLRPVMEIYSHHGQSECYAPQHLLAYEYNRMRNPERRTNTSVPGPYYAQDYWMAGKRIGVIGSSDEHSGQGGRSHGGVAAVFAGELTRSGVFDALRSKRCYATTGERILLEFSVDGLEMGMSGQRAPGDRLEITLRVWGTDMLLRVEILRHRFGVDQGFLPVLSTAPHPESCDIVLSLTEVMQAPCMYYARIVQQPLAWPGMAWTSPVWIDLPDPA